MAYNPPPDDGDDQPALTITIITLPPEPASVILPDRVPLPPRHPLPGNARRHHMARIVALVAGLLAVTAIVSVTPLAQSAGAFLHWQAQKQVAVFPTATPSHPYVTGARNFICAALPYARLAQQQITRGPRAQPHPWYISVILAQWGIEQGWQMPGYTGYNFGNVSAIGGQPFVAGTGTVGSPFAFAYAPTAEQGVADYVLFAQNGRYNAVAAAYPQGPTAQALALGASPWDAAHYTATGHPGSSLVAVLQRYNLPQYDDPAALC